MICLNLESLIRLIRLLVSVTVRHVDLAVKVTHKRISLIQRTFMEKRIKHVSLLFLSFLHPSISFISFLSVWATQLVCVSELMPPRASEREGYTHSATLPSYEPFCLAVLPTRVSSSMTLFHWKHTKHLSSCLQPQNGFIWPPHAFILKSANQSSSALNINLFFFHMLHNYTTSNWNKNMYQF